MDKILADPELSGTMPLTEEPSVHWTDWGKQISTSIKRRWTVSGTLHIDFKCGCRTGSSTLVHNWYNCCAGHREDLRVIRREMREQREKMDTCDS